MEIVKIDFSKLPGLIRDGAKVGGWFTLEVFDKDGNFKWKSEGHNLITNQGLDFILNVTLFSTTKISAWYCVLSETNTTPLATHTYAAPGYTETAAYAEATRPAYTSVASSGQSITNAASKAVFTFNAGKTIYGASLVGGGTAASTKSDTAGGGTLLCSCLLSPSKAVVSTDVGNLTYVVGAVDDGV